MPLRWKITFQIAAMLIGQLLIGAASLWGLNALHEDYGVALEGYGRLRQAYEVGAHLATARKLLGMPHRETLRAAREESRSAARALSTLPPPGAGWDRQADADVRREMERLMSLIESSPDPALASAAAEREADAVNAVLARLPRLSADIRQTTESRQEAAQTKRRATILLVAGLAGAAVVFTLLVGVAQYRSVMRPLVRLGGGVRRIAAGQFSQRLPDQGRDEFAALSADFNRMAEELDLFYHQLERQVADKSRELIRSERLASVGYLAAGVAHEINNPLGIISGYAELSLAALRGGQRAEGESSSAELERSLRIICDEAFRCKEITAQLLSLARPGEEDRRAVSLADVAHHVASIIGGLRQFDGCRLILHSDPAERLVVLAAEVEMKQVALNLAINALEAAAPGWGEVRIEVRREGQWVRLTVIDNGRGMNPQTVERVFEPFFTEKRGARGDFGRGGGDDAIAAPGAGRHGSGLGLAITHAIVRSHGGSIRAHSDGPGRGSRFDLRLPAVENGRAAV